MEKTTNNNLKNALIGIGVILLYLVASSIPYDILRIFKINYNDLNIIFKQIYMILYQLILTLIIIYIYRKDFIPNFKDFVKNNIEYFKKYIKFWFIALGLIILSNYIITPFTTSNVSENQQAIVGLLNKIPIYTFIITVIIAPILEESVFRLSFRKIFAHNNVLFILISGLVFGSMHVLGSLSNTIDLLFIIPYSIPGMIFAYCYTKSNNIFIPISLHFIHNGFTMLCQILLIFLK